MRVVIYVISALFSVSGTYAQSAKIDLSQPPVQQPVVTKQSDAELLKNAGKSEPATPMDKDLAEKYKTDVELNGTYQGVAPNTSIIQGQPQMMNVQQQQGQIGNLKTKSATYYDNEGKVRSSGTTIELGNKK